LFVKEEELSSLQETDMQNKTIKTVLWKKVTRGREAHGEEQQMIKENEGILPSNVS